MNCIKGALRVSGHTPIHDHEADDPIIAWLGMTTQLETITRAEAPWSEHWSVWAVSMSSQLSALQAGVAAAAAGSSACGRPAAVTAAYS